MANIKKAPQIVGLLKYYENKRKVELVAQQVNDEKKAELWPLVCSFWPPYDSYQKKTDRNIPVFNCQPS